MFDNKENRYIMKGALPDAPIKKLWAIDDGSHQTMLLPEDY
ncbi:hypothetical protein [Candidatus Enterococcus lemimoniae]|uniref:Uncharacterized protein n=1 Tax=Candidatus Enterococcus lemimoniae TaxID=1834167 RepID=A0ABZ2TBF4_9ENTE